MMKDTVEKAKAPMQNDGMYAWKMYFYGWIESNLNYVDHMVLGISLFTDEDSDWRHHISVKTTGENGQSNATEKYEFSFWKLIEYFLTFLQVVNLKIDIKVFNNRDCKDNK